MHPILEQYTERFKPLRQASSKSKLSQPHLKNTFYTQYPLSEYARQLPYLFDIEHFCLRLWLALLLNEKICIYSDYDTDAVTATATMYWGLIDLGFAPDQISFYAPDRFTEGYGMNSHAVEILAQENDLIISVDCGINSTQEAEVIKRLQSDNHSHTKKSCDLIITDHHHLSGNVPDCLAVLNPRLAQHYYQEPNEITLPTNVFISEIAQKAYETNETGFADIESVKKMLNEWIHKIYRSFQSVGEKPEEFVSESVTGVGVAWFCLVWFGYFLEEVEQAKKMG